MVREERQIALLSDVYSTVYELNAERRPYTFYRLMEHTERRVMVREILETVTPAREVCDVYVTVGAVSQSREGSQVNLSAETTVNVVYRGPAGGGIEVRYPLDFRYLALMPHNTTGVSDIRLDESALRNTAGQPSIVLRMVGEGERLWDIAKAYGTTMDDIVQANALGEDVLPMGQLLLIPKKR